MVSHRTGVMNAFNCAWQYIVRLYFSFEVFAVECVGGKLSPWRKLIVVNTVNDRRE